MHFDAFKKRGLPNQKNHVLILQVKFRWLASIYEVLRDKEKRAIYDRVLVEGLPDWRMPVFYYR